ncbi:MAG: mechanosensitive ion channel family protein [Gemmatimonadetes bacterium]|nr:MAG: mechanosensitive ion channel family protein [Gemmatimonadota bacterium]
MDALADIRSLYLENPLIQSLGIFILSLVLTVIVRWSLRFILLGMAKKTKTEVDDILIRAVKKVVTYSVPVIGLMVALTPLALQTPIPERILFTILAVLLMRGAISLVDDVSQWLEETWVERTASTLDKGLLPLARKALKTTIAILAVLIILGKWQVQIAPLLGALGIGGLAIALALNSSLSNLFSGIQLILDGSVNVGDKVQLESGEVGVVLDIGLRTTLMQTYDNEVISLPNSQLANARIKNYTKPDATIRVGVNFGVAYGSDVAEVKRVVLDAISQLGGILQEPEPQVLFLNMGDFSLDMTARVWVDNYGKQFARKLEMTELIYNTLNDNGIEIPFPTRTVYMKQ